MKSLRDERGDILALTAVCLTCVLAFVAFAVDMGTVLNQGRMAQTAADAAALAGVKELNWATYDNTTVTATADAAAAQNGFTNGSGGVTVTVNNGPLSGPHEGDSNYVEVIVQKNVPTYFMRLLGRNLMTVSARAVGGPGANAGCVYTLGTSGTDISVTGSLSVILQNCTAYDDSSSSNALTMNASGTLSATSIEVVGGYSQIGSGTISPTPTTGVNAVGDPLAYLPEPTIPSSCSAAVSVSGNTNRNLTAGCYDGLSMTGGGTLSLGPGLYIINGNLNLTGSGNINGTGVTFYVTGSTTLGGTGNVDLTAPTSGTYDGILVFQARNDASPVSVTGTSSMTIQGIFYGADAPISLQGNGSGDINANFVSNTLSVSGNGTFNDYNALNGNSPLQSPAIVE